MSDVTHPVDPACPYCRSHADVLAEVQKKRDQAEADRPKRGKVPGSDHAKVRFMSETGRVPDWVDPAIQPQSIKNRMEAHGG